MELIRTHPEPTLKYFYLGFVIVILGIWISTFYLAIGLGIVLIGIFALLSIKGVQINPGNQKVKAYFNFLFIKFGSWVPLSEYTHVVLGPNSNSKALGGRYITTTVRTNSYSVYLLGKNNTRLELREFVEHHLAEHYLYQIAQQIRLPTVKTEEVIKTIAKEKREFRK
ncbi:MAG: hypothetical protein JNJ99_17575 [Crocinitomicaceae bacterium]|nr:hypothetical protein [Crocinitomicaceae bacterium]